MEPIEVQNIRYVMLAFRKTWFEGNDTKMWNYLEPRVTFKRQTMDRIMFDCRNSYSLWLQELIQAVRLPLDFWFNNKLALQLFQESQTHPEKCKIYYVSENDWSETSLLEITLLEKIYDSCGYSIERTAEKLSKGQKTISYCINNKRLPPKSKALFSIEQFLNLLYEQGLDWRTVTQGYKLPDETLKHSKFALESVERIMAKGPEIYFINKEHKKRSWSYTDFVIAVCHLRDDTLHYTSEEFNRTFAKFLNKL